MKLFSNKKYNTISLYVLLVITITLLMIITIFKFASVLVVADKIVSVLMPIIWGFIIAYLLNPVMRYCEKTLNKTFFKKKPHRKASRRISVTITAIFFIAVLGSLIAVIVPEVAKSIKSIFDNLDTNAQNVQSWGQKILEDNPQIYKYINSQFTELTAYLQNILGKILPQLTNFTMELSSGVFKVLIAVKDFILGFVVAIYLLLSKETMRAQTKKTFFAIFKKNTCEKMFNLFHKSDEMFIGFIAGKIIDSFIIGILCFIGVSVLDMPYKILISVIIGVTNIIPFFGPFFGAVPSALLVLLANPEQVLAFVIFVFLLQQFDGNILGPRILGDSTGLPAFWVLFAIFVGGGLFGFIGMVLGVPTFAVIYTVFRTFVENKLKAKNLPVTSSAYVGTVTTLFDSPPSIEQEIAIPKEDSSPLKDAIIPKKK